MLKNKQRRKGQKEPKNVAWGNSFHSIMPLFLHLENKD